MALSNFNMQSLGSFLQTAKYYIPDYQREYSWDKDDQVTDFWEDLVSLNNDRINSDSSESHFFGQVVIQKEGEKNYLIDGQQRITTSIIALAAFRDVFGHLKDIVHGARYKYEDITTKYIGRYDESDDLDELRFCLGQADAKFFKENIQIGAPFATANTPAQKRIVASYKLFETKLEEAIASADSDNDKYNVLKGLYDSLTNHFQIMSLTTDNINEAFIIFETLNARGKELETSDLLKNFFFMQSSGSTLNMEQMKNRWVSMINTINKKEDATKLIRYYWNATHRYVHDKQLYKDVSKNVKNYTDSLNIVKDLEKVAELYNTLSDPSVNSCYDNKTIKHIKNLKALRVSTYYPIMISLFLKNETEENVLRVVKAIEVMAFRDFAIASKNPNGIERTLASTALDYYKGLIPVDNVISIVKDLSASDDELSPLLDCYKPTNDKLAKFILREIESHISTSPEMRLNDSDTVINLEHIMPRDNSIWQYPAEEHDDIYTMLGNMTLLAEKWNKSISNKLFVEKKEKYAQSAIQLTHKLLAYDVWNKDTILQRAQFFKNQILEIWAL